MEDEPCDVVAADVGAELEAELDEDVDEEDDEDGVPADVGCGELPLHAESNGAASNGVTSNIGSVRRLTGSTVVARIDPPGQ